MFYLHKGSGPGAVSHKMLAHDDHIAPTWLLLHGCCMDCVPHTWRCDTFFLVIIMQTNWTLRSLVHSWAQEHGIPVPASLAIHSNTQPSPEEGDISPSSSAPSSSCVHSHPILMAQPSSDENGSASGTGQAVTVPESWTFFQGVE